MHQLVCLSARTPAEKGTGQKQGRGSADNMATVWVLFCVVLLPGAWCLQWSAGPEDGATVYVCEGKELTLPWTVRPDTGEQITDIEWSVHGHSDQMVAMYSHGMFFPSPSYSQRVQHLSNAGITLSHVTAGDAGTYTVEVNIDDRTGVHTTHIHTAVLHVASASIARVDASLEVVQQPAAVYNNHTEQYHVQLTCTSHGQQPPAVIWTTPSQKMVQSSSNDNGRFSLLLDNPITGGNYTCRLPADSPAARCLARNDPVLEGSTVNVDEVKARFSTLEARIQTVETENSLLKQQVQTLEVNSKTVIFHAGLGSDMQVSGGQHIIPTRVSVNQGGGYNNRTGEFVVPYSGHYFFTATTASYLYSTSRSYYANLSVMVDGLYVSYIYTKSVSNLEQGTCSYAGHLNKGQRVWLMANGDGYFDAPSTTFSAFLVSPDSD